MRPLFTLAATMALVGCTTAYESCVTQVTKDLKIVRSLIADTEATIDRGYAIQTEQRYVNYTTFCIGHHDTIGVNFCTRPHPVVSKKPVAVDLDAERRKLRSLKRKEKELESRSAKLVAECEAKHPKS